VWNDGTNNASVMMFALACSENNEASVHVEFPAAAPVSLNINA
jgi:hypothetical protein